MMLQKLTPGEITRTVAKIRDRYELYHSRFLKSWKLKGAFEDRYLQALRARVDISAFLLAELSAGGEMEGREPRQGFADRVLEEQRARILKYPLVDFHPDVREEVRRLVGA